MDNPQNPNRSCISFVYVIELLLILTHWGTFVCMEMSYCICRTDCGERIEARTLTRLALERTLTGISTTSGAVSDHSFQGSNLLNRCLQYNISHASLIQGRHLSFFEGGTTSISWEQISHSPKNFRKLLQKILLTFLVIYHKILKFPPNFRVFAPETPDSQFSYAYKMFSGQKSGENMLQYS